MAGPIRFVVSFVQVALATLALGIACLFVGLAPEEQT